MVLTFYAVYRWKQCDFLRMKPIQSQCIEAMSDIYRVPAALNSQESKHSNRTFTLYDNPNKAITHFTDSTQRYIIVFKFLYTPSFDVTFLVLGCIIRVIDSLSDDYTGYINSL